MSKIAVVLFNLGGPDNLAAVQPFLQNLFSDPAILGVPAPIRWLLARFISRRRAPIAQEIYKKIGGASPLLPLTREQAAALEALFDSQQTTVKCFIAMRYWHPFSTQTVAEVKRFAPDKIVLLPLYPQFSTTTSESSLLDWQKIARAEGLNCETHTVCCYPTNQGLIAAQAAAVQKAAATIADFGAPRLLFSAHGLPQKIVDGGDPYQWQVEQTAAAVVAKLQAEAAFTFDWAICYQSRVGPLKWLEPSLKGELQRAAQDRKPVVVIPIAFVSEHSETLVELDIEYHYHAKEMGVPAYARAPAVGSDPRFIKGLRDLVLDTLNRTGMAAEHGERICPGTCRRCAMS